MKFGAFPAFFFSNALFLAKSALALAVFFILQSNAPAFGQKSVFSDDFSFPVLSSFTTANGPVSGTSWTMYRSGGDMGAQINGGSLTLTNNASFAGNGNGHVFVHQNAATAIPSPYNPRLDLNQGMIEWRIIMQHNVPTPSGFFTGIPYGTGFAYILASNSTTPATSGTGFALIHGGGTMPGRLDIIRFNGGLQSGTNTSVIDNFFSCSGGCQSQIGNDEAEIRVTYDPWSGGWQIISNLTNGTSVPGGAGYDNTYTNLVLPYFGLYWQASAGSSKSVSCRAMEVTVSPRYPQPAALSYNQNFGSSSFLVFPEAFEGWAGLDGAVVTSQALAETTPASINCPIAPQSTSFNSAPTGGLYGYGAGSNGKIAVGTTADALQGVNQPVSGAVADTTVNQFLVSYDLEVLYSGNKPTGNVLVSRSTDNMTSTPWTPVPGSAVTFPTSPSLGDKRSCTFMVTNAPTRNYQKHFFRWATWREPTGTTSSTIGLDNVRFTALATPEAVTITSSPPGAASFVAGTTNVILQRIDLTQNTAATTASINSLIINTYGTYSASDLVNLKVRYSPDATLTGADPTLAVKTTGLNAEIHDMSPFASQLLPTGATGYLFITADFSATALGGKYIRVTSLPFDNIGISGAAKLGIGPVSSGNSQMILNTPAVNSPPTAESFTPTTATLTGNILNTGGTSVTKRGFFYSLTNGFANGTGTEVSTTGIYSDGTYNISASGLAANTTYYFKSFAVNSIGTTYSAQGSFTTAKLEPSNNPTSFACGTTGLTSIALSWTDATGVVLPDGYLISWSPTSYAAITNPTDGSPVTNNSFNLNVAQGVQTATINNLTYNQPYYFKIFSYTNSGNSINYRTATFGQTTCATLSGQTETFETGTKVGYATADATCVLGSWNMNDALIGTSAADAKVGLQSVRMRNNTGYLTMNWDLPNGVSTVSIKHALYGTDATAYWALEYSLNSGSTWAPVGSNVTTSSTTLTTQSFTVNQPGAIRFRIDKLTNTNRINLDDILFVPYCAAPLPTSSVSFTNTDATGTDAAWGSASGSGTMLVVRPTASANAAPVLGTFYTANLNWASAGQIDVNNRVVFRGAGSSASGITGLTAETQYTATAYNYNTTSNCYQRDGAASATFHTLSLKPAAHSATFSVHAASDTKAYLNFSPASTITNADGYILIQKSSTAPVSKPANGTAYTSGFVIGDATVSGLITGAATDDYIVSGLTPNTLYYFELIPFNWDGTNPETYHYRTDATIPLVSTTTSLPESVQSDVIKDPTFIPTSNINFALYQGATVTNTTGNVAVFRVLIRDGGGMADSDLYPTILDYLKIHCNVKTAIRAAGLFGGTNQNTFIASALVGASSMEFSGLSTAGSLVTAADGETIELTLRVTFYTLFEDNKQLQFSVYGAANAIAFPGASSQFYDFPVEHSSMVGDYNRLEVIATTIDFIYQPTQGEPDMALETFAVGAIDVFGNLDVDQNGCQIVLTKAGGVGTMSAPGNPYTFANGIIKITDVSFSTATPSAKVKADAVSCLGSSTVTSSVINIVGITYATNDYRTIGGPGLSWGTLAHWQRHNGFTFVAASVLPPANSNVYIQGSMTGNVTITVLNLTILSGGNLTTAAANTITTTNALVKNGGRLTLNSDMPVNTSGSFAVENNGSVTINFAATNQSALWNGIEAFSEASEFVIKNWGVSAVPATSRIVYTNQITVSKSIRFYNKTGPGCAFGNLTIDLTTNLGNTLYLTNGVNDKGLAYGTLTVRSTNPAQRISYFGAATSGSSAVGGNLVVDANYASTGTFQISGSGSNLLSIYGDMNLNAASTVLKSNNGTGVDTITVYGNLNIGTANLLFNGVASSGDKVTLKLEGDVSVSTTGNLGNFSATSGIGNYHLQFSGNGDGLTSAKMQEVSIASTSTTAENVNISFEALTGSFVSLANQDLELGQNSGLKIESGATFDFGFTGTTGLKVSKSGSATGTSFTAESNSVLKITSATGINLSGASGNVQTDGRTFGEGITYWYTGKITQYTGTVLASGSTPKTIICDLFTSGITLSTSAPVQLPRRSGIQIRKGIFEESEVGPVSGDGYLTFLQGTYRSKNVGSVFPNLSDFDRYDVSMGSFEMGAMGNQILNRLPSAIQSLTISGSGTKTLSESLVITNSLNIAAGDLDLGPFRVTGNGGLTMTGGSLKLGYSGAALYPELTGTASPYSLTGGTIELYGTSESTGSQTLRTNYGLSETPVVYNNLKLNASESNFSTYNIATEASLQIAGNMEIFYPAVFYLTHNHIVSGTGSFTVQPKACLKYEEKNGLTAAACGTGIACGQIRTATRTFSSEGRYWISGNQSAMVSGTGLPSTVHTLMVNRTGTNPVTLSNDVTVTYFLGVQNSGMLETGSKKIILSDTALVVEEELAHVMGKLETTRTLGLASHNFGGMGLEIDADGAAPGSTVVSRQTGITISGAGGQAIKRKFSISPTVNTGLNATLVFKYFDDEINSLDENNFSLYRSVDAGATWTLQGGVVDTDFNRVTKTGINAFSEWTLGDVNTPLPLRVVYFGGKPDFGKSTLEWKVAEEKKTDYYKVMKSEDGNRFDLLGTVPAYNNHQPLVQYSLIDPSFTHSAYYSLYLVENGVERFHQTIFVPCNCREPLQINAFPNPTTGQISLRANQAMNENLIFQVQLSDMDGRILVDRFATYPELETMVNTSLGAASSGLYQIHIVGQELNQHLRIRKL